MRGECTLSDGSSGAALNVGGYEGLCRWRGGTACRFDRHGYGVGVFDGALYGRRCSPRVVRLEEPGGFRSVIAQDPGFVGLALRRGWGIIYYQHGPLPPYKKDLSPH